MDQISEEVELGDFDPTEKEIFEQPTALNTLRGRLEMMYNCKIRGLEGHEDVLRDLDRTLKLPVEQPGMRAGGEYLIERLARVPLRSSMRLNLGTGIHPKRNRL